MKKIDLSATIYVLMMVVVFLIALSSCKTSQRIMPAAKHDKCCTVKEIPETTK